MLDDHARAARLRETPRTDVALGHRMRRFAEAMQDRITREAARLDARALVRERRWEHPDGGDGRARVVEGGDVFAGGTVSVASVHGALDGRAAAALGAPVGRAFCTTGLALALRAVNPYVPTVHAGFRHVALGADAICPDDQWFDGGVVLTAAYPFEEDAAGFYRVWKAVCDRHPGVADYAAFRAACERRFSRPEHGERTGGGICYDHLRDDPEGAFLFIRDAARALLSSYVPILERRRATPYGRREQDAQALHRERCAAFFDAPDGFQTETAGSAS